jgi:CIC family chloride channel protein
MEEQNQQFRKNQMGAWIPEFLQLGSPRVRSQVRMLVLATLVGVVAGVGAILFYIATQAASDMALGWVVGYKPEPQPSGHTPLTWLPQGTAPFRPWLFLVVPTIGGLLSGWLVFRFAPEAEGHGTDSVIDAYHRKDGYIRPRVPAVKIIASALTIGSGGSGGREGPIAQIGAGFGSILAGLLHLRPVDRRILLAAGMGAGIAAIFRAPLAGALFAAEVLYWSPEFEPEVIMPAGIASVVSYCTFGLYAGWKPLFDIPGSTFTHPRQLFVYSLLIVAMVILASIYVRTFYGIRNLFQRWGIPRSVKPAIGAFLSGLTGLALYYAFGRNELVLSVMSFGYNGLQAAMSPDGGVSAAVLLAIALGKILTTSLTISSGGSGGVFGPSMVIGGCGGGALGLMLQGLGPAWAPSPTNCVVVGMAGFFAAAAKTPFSTLIMVSELTGGYDLLLPTLWVCVLAFMLSDNRTIYSSQVESRSRSPAHQGSFVRDVISGVQVREFLTSPAAAPVLSPQDQLPVILGKFEQSGFPVLPVVDDDQRLLGIVNVEELSWTRGSPGLSTLLVADDLMRTNIRPLVSTDELDRAMELFVENDVLALPVVNDLTQLKVIGMVRRFDIASRYLGHVHGLRPKTG